MTLPKNDPNYTAVDFIETYTGSTFFPMKPNPADVSIIDIAHSLAYQCRWGGHSEFFYSIAQHCCLLENYVARIMNGSALDRLMILMHDAPEAYLHDMVRPVKQYMPEFREREDAVAECIKAWLGISGVPVPEWLTELDSRIVSDEHDQLMSGWCEHWEHDFEPLGLHIEPWLPRVAEQQFLMRFAYLAHQISGNHCYLRSGWGVPMKSEYNPMSFRTLGSDVPQYGRPDAGIITDVLEVDLIGGVARVAMRSPNGMFMRDTRAGQFPRPAWKWLHGTFKLETPEVHSMPVNLVDDLP